LTNVGFFGRKSQICGISEIKLQILGWINLFCFHGNQKTIS